MWERHVAAEAAFRNITIKSLLVPSDILHQIHQVSKNDIYPAVTDNIKGIRGTPWVYEYHNNSMNEVFGIKYKYVNVGGAKPLFLYLPTKLRSGDTLLLESQEQLV